jgi:hypothetical protein
MKAVGVYMQLRHNLVRSSVRGQSVDAIFWLVWGNLAGIVYDYYLLTDVQVQQQHVIRYNEPVAIDYVAVLFTLHQFVAWVAVLVQTLHVYRHTMHAEVQRNFWISGVLVTALMFTTFCLKWCSGYRVHDNLGYYGIMRLDYVNWFWLLQQFAFTTYPVPLFAVNWKLMTTNGISFYFIVAELLAALSAMVTLHHLPADGFDLIISTLKAICFLAILYQFRIYSRRKLQREQDV